MAEQAEAEGETSFSATGSYVVILHLKCDIDASEDPPMVYTPRTHPDLPTVPLKIIRVKP